MSEHTIDQARLDALCSTVESLLVRLTNLEERVERIEAERDGDDGLDLWRQFECDQ